MLGSYGEYMDYMLLPKNLDLDALKWADFKKSVSLVHPDLSKHDKLFDDYNEFKRSYAALALTDKFQALSISQKWCQILKNENFEVLPIFVEKIMCLPGSNAFVERIFSLLKI
uniref:Uncharacterized protein n=1 Tax=Acrobeloides nanus TaxID=290746 RepID=A0A914DMU0_9BILA